MRLFDLLKHQNKIQTKEDILKSKHFCIVPWLHTYILPENKILPCCVSQHDDYYGDLNSQTLQEAWNSEKYRTMRKMMLEDRPVFSCNQCYTLDKVGASTMRTRMNRDFIHHSDLIDKTSDNGEVTNLKLYYMDVRFSNRCNFKCRGCGPSFSTSWYEDHEKLWDFKSEEPKIIHNIADNPRLWHELEEQLDHVEWAYFAGGEPLMMDEHYQCLEYLIEKGRTDVVLKYNSNLSVLRFKKYDLVALWKQFKDVDLMVSLDDIESRGEYFRSGLSWEKFVNNLKKVKADLPHVRISVNCTISLFNIARLPEIHSFLYGNGFIKALNGFLFNSLLTPDCYRTQVLSDTYKKKTAFKLNAYLEKLKSQYPDENWIQFENDLKTQIQFMMDEDRTHQKHEFIQRTLKLDKIRGENFFDTYPEFRDEFK